MNALFFQRSGYMLDVLKNIWVKTGYVGINYSDGDEIEQRIAGIVSQAIDISVLSTELREHCTDWPSLYHLSGMRANIIRPFDNIIKGDILEVGAGCGAITRYLGECGANILAVEGSPRRAAIARSRTRDLENVTVLAEKFDQFQFDHQFNVITLIGVLEYANLFTSEENPPLAMLKRIRKLLKPDGKLIIAIENQLGLKYFAGAPEDHLGLPMYGVEALYKTDEAQTFGRHAIAELLLRAGFGSQEFLAPFPDYKLPISIISERAMQADDFDAAAFVWSSVRRDPQLPEYCNFALERTWPVVAANHLMMDLSNSFLICANLSDVPSLEVDKLAWHFSVDRKRHYTKQATFLRSESNAISVKYLRLAKTDGPGPADDLVEFTLPEEDHYYFGDSLLILAVDIVGQPGWHPNKVGQFLVSYLEILTSVLAPDFAEKISSPYTLLPGWAFDLTPQNIISLEDGSYSMIDKEWALREPIEVGHLLLRTLLLLLNTVTHFGRPKDGRLFTRKEFLHESLAAASMPLKQSDVIRYLERESQIRLAIIGGSSTDLLEWEPDKALPILSETEGLQIKLTNVLQTKANAEEWAHKHLSDLDKVQSQLKVTEVAKANAEELAHKHLSDLDKVQSQLKVTEVAKANAEELAFERLADIDFLKFKVDSLNHDIYKVETELIKKNEQLEKIRVSLGFKLLAALRLVPKRDS